METAEDWAVARIRERPAGRPSWTFRCHRPERDVLVDVDAFDERRAAAAAAAHWGIEPDLVQVEGRRRRWLRWIGLSTHDAGDAEHGRGWWVVCKLGFAVALGIAILWPALSAIGEALREQRELGIAVKRAELERLEAGKELPPVRPTAEEDGGHDG